MDPMRSNRVHHVTNRGPVLASFLALAASACGPLADTNDPTAQQIDPIVSCAHSTTLEGIDVSSWDGTIDWAAVRSSGHVFAIARVSDGLYVDTTFDHHWTAMRAAGVVRGAYQFFRPAIDPNTQADLFLRHLGTLQPGDLPPTLDVEVADGVAPATIASRIHTWVNRVQAATGRVPMIYTGKYIWQDSITSSDFAANPLWIAQYGPTCPDLPTPWTSWSIFQYSDHGTVPGLTSSVDLDRFNGTLADLQRFTEATVVAHDAGTPGTDASSGSDAHATTDAGSDVLPITHTGGSSDASTGGDASVVNDGSARDGAASEAGDAAMPAALQGSCTASPAGSSRTVSWPLLALLVLATVTRRKRV